ncbi:MAG: TerC family protein [Syntrophorhabdaceae bacterium]|nr:TerC family protein [Syntrophorhabdaceae bacterium]
MGITNLIGDISFTWNFVLAFLSIILIDILLAGDNAVVIAMAVRSLPQKQRKKGIIFGAGAAAVLRIILTFFAAKLLSISFVKFIGGLFILWIGIKLFVEGAPEENIKKEAKTLRQAIITIVIADLIMSTDNVLAVAGASHGNLFLLIFGLGLSIPFVVFTSNLISRLIDRFPFLVYIGAAILGRVGGEMIITDPYIVKLLHNPSHLTDYILQGVFAFGVVIAGKTLLKIKAAKNKQIDLASEKYTYNPFMIERWDII